MNILKRLKAKILKQTPMNEEEMLSAYMKATARGVKPTPLFVRDFIRIVEGHHGIGGKKEVAFIDEEKNHREV
jgi:hypothetical protein